MPGRPDISKEREVMTVDVGESAEEEGVVDRDTPDGCKSHVRRVVWKPRGEDTKGSGGMRRGPAGAGRK